MRFIVIALVVFTTPAFAQQQGPAPCTRSENVVKIGGVDLDEMRCALALQQQRLGVLQGSVFELEAKVTLLEADLAAAKTEAAKPLAAVKQTSPSESTK